VSAYGWVIIGTIIGPFCLSFDKKVAFYKRIPSLFPALLVVGIIFLVWDDFFTRNGVWGFTPTYLTGFYISKLPIEEVLFFLVVPYACVFIYACLESYFPLLKAEKTSRIFAYLFLGIAIIMIVYNPYNWYTVSACSLSILLTVIVYFIRKEIWFERFVVTYLIALIPFLIVNGILTGAITENPIVWYSEKHIIGLRIYTIPIEDLFYNYAMLLPVTWLFVWFESRRTIRVNHP
jgi:lycopene cyclase domain-containing protein